tara:strand:+ start:157 stop:624 length:468 start_codon:yes stop_codon:yes gene_type:complete
MYETNCPSTITLTNPLTSLTQDKFERVLNKSQTILSSALSADPLLRDENIQFVVEGRTKELYSLWLKMNEKNENLSKIKDVVALRVILWPEKEKEILKENSNSSSNSNSNSNSEEKSVWLCYHVLGLVQNLPLLAPVPGSVKDYISLPKPNNYQR